MWFTHLALALRPTEVAAAPRGASPAACSVSHELTRSAMHLLRVLPPLLVAPSFCHAFLARPFVAYPKHRHVVSSTPHHRPVAPHQPNMNMNQPAEVPEKLRQANLKAHIEVWDSRRDMTRATLSAAKALRGARESIAGEDAAKDSLVEDGKGSLVISAIALAVAAATLRLGGRAALVSVRNCTSRHHLCV